MSRRLADRRQRRRRRLAFWGLVAALLVYGVFVGDYRPHHVAVLWMEERRTERAIEDLRAESESLAGRLALVREDSLILERMAREKGMIREGDLIYRIVRVPPDLRQESVGPPPGTAERPAADTTGPAADTTGLDADTTGLDADSTGLEAGPPFDAGAPSAGTFEGPSEGPADGVDTPPEGE